VDRASRDRHRRAEALFAAGATRAEVARRLGIARSTAGAWYRRLADDGAIAPRRRGPRPRLAPDVLDALARALRRPPRLAGFSLDRWSLAAVVRWIEGETGVVHHPRHVGRVLRRAGFVVPPVGPHAGRALFAREVRDPDGNAVRLLERASVASPPSPPAPRAPSRR
jgi:transposase